MTSINVTTSIDMPASDSKDIIEGVVAAVMIVGATLEPFDCLHRAGNAIVGLFPRPLRNRRRDGVPEATVRDVASAMASFILAVAYWPVASVVYSPRLVRGARRLVRRLSLYDEASRRRPDSNPEDREQVFLSYHSAAHRDDAEAIARALSERGLTVWFDGERGTLPTRLLLLDRVLEDSIRSARVVVSIIPTSNESRTEVNSADDLDRVVSLFLLGVMWSGMVLSLFYDGMKGRPTDWVAHTSLQDLMFRATPPPLRKFWYRAMCGIDVDFEKHVNESWSDWESRIAALYGVPVVTVLTGREDLLDKACPAVFVADPKADDDEYQRLADLVSGAQIDLAAPLPAAKAELWEAFRKHPLLTVWRLISPPAPGLQAEI
jgi:hypothetical protein